MGKKRTREVQDDPTVDKMDEDDSSSDDVSLIHLVDFMRIIHLYNK